MKKSLFIAIIIIIASTLFAACNQNSSDSVGSREVVDLAGRNVILPNVIESVFVDFGAPGNMLVMTLGATEKLIAIQPGIIEAFPWARILTPEIENVTVSLTPFTSGFGQPIIPPDSGNIEGLLAYNPDLIITNRSANIEVYENFGFATILVDVTSDYKAFVESMIVVGTALGNEYLEVAIMYSQFFESIKELVSNRVSNVDNKVNVYYLDGRFDHPYTTIGTGEIQEAWILYAGGNLATADLFTGRNVNITAEQFLVTNPDVIMIGGLNQRIAYEALTNHPALSQLDAVINERVYYTPTGLFQWCRHGPEAILQILWTAKILYPELFIDVEIIEIANNFYKTFYNVELTDGHIQDILNGRPPGG
jgi:iron complex transport system substrate-binding protein